MNIDSPMGFNSDSAHLIILLPNGSELEHKQVPTSETLWSILSQFETQFNHNLCKRYNNENRFELPQLSYNNYPFASTLQQLLSTKLSDISKHRKTSKDAIQLTLAFKPQAFSINELDQRISNIQKQLKKQEKTGTTEMDIDHKNDANDAEDTTASTNKLDKDFAMDIDPIKAESVEEVFRKMEMLLYKLCKVLKSKDEFINCMKLLRKVVNNLIIHPLDKPDNDKNKDPSKYRKLNLNNEKLKKNLFNYQPALDLLILIGFVQQSDGVNNAYLIMPEHNENTVIFSALIVKIANCQPPKQQIPEIEKNIKIYELEDLRKFKVDEAKLIAQQQAAKSDGAVSDASLSSQHRMAMQNAYKMHHPTQLMGKELREKKYGVKQKEYRFTVIRIEFPSKKVLEVRFHPNTAIFKLFEFVETMLDQRVLKLKYQLLLPPHQVIKNKRDESQTFKTMGGMIPACTVRFVLNPKSNKNIEYNDNYMKQEMINKYLTKDITSLRSDKLNNSLNSNDEQKNDGNNNESNQNKKKQSKKMTAAQIRAAQRKKALLRKMNKLNDK